MKYQIFFFLLCLFPGCNLVTLEDGSVEGIVAGPRTVPSSEEQIESILVGDSKRTWKAYQFTLLGNAGFQNCRLDDQMVLSIDKSYSYNGGQVLCGAEDNKEFKSGNWFVQNDKLIFVENEQTQYAAQILGLVQDTLVIRGTYLGLEIKGLYIAN